MSRSKLGIKQTTHRTIVVFTALIIGIHFGSENRSWSIVKKTPASKSKFESTKDQDLEALEELEQALESDGIGADEKKNVGISQEVKPKKRRDLQSEELPGEIGGEEPLETDSSLLSQTKPEKMSSQGKSEESPSVMIRPSQSLAKVQNSPEIANEITNLEFKMEGDVSRVLVSSRSKLLYKEFKNSATKQVVYVLENTQVPERLERAYDTSEFVSPVALFTLLQVPKSKSPTAKLIVQLREDKVPTVVSSERGLTIDFAAPEKSGDSREMLGQDESKLLPEESNFAQGTMFYGKPIERLEIKNTDIQDVLRLIGRTSGYNIVIGEDVTGKIGSISLENIPWDQAFAIVLQSKKLGYIRQGNVLRVATLASLKAEKDEIAAVEQSKVKAETLRTVLIPVSYAKAQDLAPKGKSILTERGSLEVDERSNSIIVRDIDRVIGKLQKLYAMLDTQPPIVSVSAKVVEMKSDFSRSFGMNALKLAQNTSGLAGEGFDFSPEGGTAITIKRPEFARLEAKIGLAELEGETRVLANPSLAVNQNQKAVFNQTLSAFYKVQQQAVAGAIPQQTLQAIDTTLSLEATPIVSGDGSISMTVNIKNEVPQSSSGAAEVAIDKRSIQTQVLLENGDTAVIGGAFSSTASSTQNGVPGLMRLPLVGLLFSNREIKETKNEILIFLTAKILNAEESFKRAF